MADRRAHRRARDGASALESSDEDVTAELFETIGSLAAFVDAKTR